MSYGYLTITRPGPLSTLQDAGRFGVRHLGITQGGPADIQAWGWANWLVGNVWGTAALEITLGGLALIAEQPCLLALCGADMQAHLNGQPQTNNESFTLAAGDELTLGMARSGMRSYLAVLGGFIAKPILGSVACVTRDKLGGHKGNGCQLEDGDKLHFSHGINNSIPQARTLPSGILPDYGVEPDLHLIPGAQFRFFDDHSVLTAFSQPWQLDPQSNRMAIKLQGSRLHCSLPRLISEGLTLGAVQVPPDGQPIVLLNDRQTIGGYPRLGTLTPLACARLAQCQPSTTVRLSTVTARRAQAEYRAFRALMDSYML